MIEIHVDSKKLLSSLRLFQTDIGGMLRDLKRSPLILEQLTNS